MSDRNDHDKLIALELVVKQNADAITKLSKTVDILAKTLEKEDARQRDIIDKVVLQAERCETRHQEFLKRFDDKRVMISKLEKQIETKVEKQVFDRVVNRLWTIGGAVITILIGSTGYMIKMILEGLK